MKVRTENFSKLAILMAMATSMIGSAAYATGPHDTGDFFGRSTDSITPARAPITGSVQINKLPSAHKPLYHYGDKPAQKWFASLDEQVVTHMVTSEEKSSLLRDFGDPPQLERVIEWTNTAGHVAKKYRALARNLRAMSIPPELTSDRSAPTDCKVFLQSLANWYDDSASVMEEYIKPRHPARTQEELDDQLKRVHQRSENVKTSFNPIAEMDSHLRSHFQVQAAFYDNKIIQYASQKPQ